MTPSNGPGSAAGKHRFYRADRQALGPLAVALEAMWATALDRLAAVVEADPEPNPPSPRPRLPS